MNNTVAKFVQDVAYDTTDYTTTQVTNYYNKPTAYSKEEPRGLHIKVPNGTAITVTCDGKTREEAASGEHFIYNIEPLKNATLSFGGKVYKVVAEGDDTLALDSCAHAEGYETIAAGGYSHSEGYKTRAMGTFTHTEGEGTIASSANQHVQGRYNIEDSNSKYLHIVGNGNSNTNRSNAHTVDKNGNGWFAGTIEGTALILKSSTPNSTKRFRITVDDSGTISATAIN